MDAVARFLTDNALIIAALATVAYAILTYMLWSDARMLRTTAHVAVYPAPFDPTARYAAVVAENYGPAVARDFDLQFHLADESGVDIGGGRHHREPVLGPGRPRRFLPRVTDDKIETLDELANRGAHVQAEWQWRDQDSLLGSLIRRVPKASLAGGLVGNRVATRGKLHTESATFSLRELRDGLYGGGAIAEHDPIDALPGLERAVEALTKEVTGIHRIMAEPGLRRAREAMRAQMAAEAAVPDAAAAPPTAAEPPKRGATRTVSRTATPTKPEGPGSTN